MEKGVFRTMCEGSAHLTDDGSSEKARHIMPLDPILVPFVQHIVQLQLIYQNHFCSRDIPKVKGYSKSTTTD